MEQAGQGIGPMLDGMFREKGALSKGFYEKYGKEALPIIAAVESRCGTEQGKLMQKTAPAKTVEAACAGFKVIDDILVTGLEILEMSDDKFHCKSARCPLGIQGTSRELCEALMNNEKSLLSAFLDREVEMKVIKSVAAGDNECEVVYFIK
jgi:hypothetical protein